MGCQLNFTLLFRHLESNEVKAGEKALAGFNSKTAEADRELSIHLSLGIHFHCVFPVCFYRLAMTNCLDWCLCNYCFVSFFFFFFR